MNKQDSIRGLVNIHEAGSQSDQHGKHNFGSNVIAQDRPSRDEESERSAADLKVANAELAFQNREKEKRASELLLANYRLAFENEEKEKRAAELLIANCELAFQNEEKEKRAAELIVINRLLKRQNEEVRLANEQRAFESRNLDAMINNTNDLMWSIDRNFKLITSNKPFDTMILKLYGRQVNKGFGILSLDFSEEKLARFKRSYERVFAGEIFSEIEYTDIPEPEWTEVSYFPIKNGNEILGSACHSRNITKLKHAELEYIAITNDLLQRNNALEQFSQIVSHNLRAPVANILGATNMFNNMSLTEDEKLTISRGINESASKLDDVITELNRILQNKA